MSKDGVELKPQELRKESLVGKLVMKIGQLIAPTQQSTIRVGGATVTVTSTSTGGTQLNSRELASSAQVKSFLNAVRLKTTVQKG